MSVKYLQLGDVCNVRRGTTITKQQTISGIVPVVGGGTKSTYFHSISNRDAGCITISGSGASAGYVNYWNEPIFASDCSTVEPRNNNDDRRFIYYYLQANQDYIYSNFRSGAAQPHVYAKDIATLEYPILDLSTQQKIVEKLDAIFAEIDKATAAAEANIKNAEALFQSYLTDIFNNLYALHGQAKISDFCIFENGDRGKNYPSKAHQVEVGIPFINAGDLGEGWTINRKGMAYITPERFNLLGAGKVKVGDLLFCLRGSLGKCGIVEDIDVGAIASSLVIIRPMSSRAINKYIYWFLSSSFCANYINKTKGGAAQPNLSAKVVMNYKLPDITVVEQNKIVNLIDSFYLNTSKLKQTYASKLSDLSVLKQSVLRQAFNGELVKE